ncbi:MAG TPA: hypothetical protein VL970_04835, partial [Candidatus Acidoferrales bacterium]|nr:hypothetical protein [Candidatus Acidoferrales bacterium]
YKRFYFRDIQAISIQQTKRYNWWFGITGVLALVWLIFLIAVMPKTPPTRWSGDEIAGGIALGCVNGFCLFLFFMNLLLGLTCRCFVRTAVQTEALPSLCRLRRARKVLARIRPLIAVAQGELTPEEVSARMQETFRAQNPTELPGPTPSGSVPPAVS